MRWSISNLNNLPSKLVFDGSKDQRSIIDAYELLYSINDIDNTSGLRVEVVNVGKAIFVIYSSRDMSLRRETLNIIGDNLDFYIVEVCKFIENSQIRSDYGVQQVASKDLIIRDTTMPHEFSFGVKEGVLMIVPRSVLHRRLKRIESKKPMIFPGSDLYIKTIADFLLLIESRLDKIDKNFASSLAEGLISMLASLIDAGDKDATCKTPKTSNARILEARDIVRKHALDPNFSSGELAKQLGMSRASLYRLLEPVDGVSALIRKTRLSHANKMLRSSEYQTMQVQTIAQLCGFNRMDSFARAFKEHYSITPKQAREAYFTSIVSEDKQSPSETLRQWLNELNWN